MTTKSLVHVKDDRSLGNQRSLGFLRDYTGKKKFMIHHAILPEGNPYCISGNVILKEAQSI